MKQYKAINFKIKLKKVDSVLFKINRYLKKINNFRIIYLVEIIFINLNRLYQALVLLERALVGDLVEGSIKE